MTLRVIPGSKQDRVVEDGSHLRVNPGANAALIGVGRQTLRCQKELEGILKGFRSGISSWR